MKKNEKSKLVLNKQTVRQLQQPLSDEQLKEIAGGGVKDGPRPMSYDIC